MLGLPLILCLVLAGCAEPPKTSSAGAEVAARVEALAKAPYGLDLRVVKGGATTAKADQRRVAEATPISDEEVVRLVGRLPAVEGAPEATDELVLRPATVPPPRKDDVVVTSFPPPASKAPPAPASEAPKLEVLRWMPDGKVRAARELTVVFNQPMIALTSFEAAAGNTPAKLTPQPPGQWRWIDTRTLQFRAEREFPKATIYNVEVSAGTRSVDGSALATARTFTFETPPLAVESHFPDSSQPEILPDVPIVVLFDQDVEPAALIANVNVTAGDQAVPVRILDNIALEEAARGDKALDAFLDAPRKAGHMARILALRPERELPKETWINIVIAAGARSSEGPIVTAAASNFGFRTLAPLRFMQDGCSDTCGQDDTFSVKFNNALDAPKFDAKLVEVTPAVSDLEVELSDRSIHLEGSVRPRTNYDVKISGHLADVHGQALGEAITRKWRVGDARAYFRGLVGMTVLEPHDKPMMEVFSRGHERLRVKLYRVEPKDYAAYRSFNHHDPDKTQEEPPGTKVFDDSIAAVNSDDGLAPTRIDLSAAMIAGGLGHAIAIVEPEPIEGGYSYTSWIQSTRLALDAVADDDGVVVFVSDLATGRPQPGVDVTIEPGGVSGRTDDKGLVTMALAGANRTLSTIVARRDNDTAILPTPTYSYWSWRKPAAESLVWYVTDDRGTYRPGEDVTLKGWIRSVDTRKHGDVGAVPGVAAVEYVVYDARKIRIAEGSADVSATGSFDTNFKLPETPNLGAATIMFTAMHGETTAGNDSRFTHRVDIREFRRPEYEVTTTASEGLHYVGDSADLTVRAAYFGGGPLPLAPVRWTIKSQRRYVAFPGHDDYEFGVVSLWRGERHYGDGATKAGLDANGITDVNGNHTLRLDLASAKPAAPMAVTAEAEVTDVNSQAWSSSTWFIVHPGDLYVGVKIADRWFKQGSKPVVSVIGVDRDGKPAIGAAIEVTAARSEWSYAGGHGEYREIDVQKCFVVSGEKPSTCEFKADQSGSYNVVATIVDSEGRPSQTQSSFWVSSYEAASSLNVEQEKIELLADRKEYAPGDTARVSVGLPFYPAEAVVTVRRSGVLETRRLTIDKATTFDVAIDDAMVPNVYVQVDAVGSVARKADKAGAKAATPRPAYATGQVELAVPPKGRTLDVKVRPRDVSVAPAAETGLTVEVRDSSGNAVADAEVAVFVVDESILALAGFQFADPMKPFYPRREAGGEDLHSREYVVRRSDEGGGAYGEPEELPASPPESSAPLFLRKDFRPLAAFFPSLVTDASGIATATFKLPDSVTRYRVVAIAASGVKRFGKGESSITTRQPLIARPSAPRFLNFGDVFELPVVVQNQTDKEVTVRVALRTQNLRLTAGAGREVKIPPDDRVEVRFPAAADRAGEATFQVVATSDSASDAASVKLPVRTPATTEAFATYGVIDDGNIHQPIMFPSDVLPSFGGLDVTTSSTNLQALTDAFLYLVRYPYECGEQISSRILGIVALEDVLTAFNAPGVPSAAELRRQVEKDVADLAKKQSTDGGFMYWTGDKSSDPFLSVHVTHALARAKARGIEVPGAMLANARQFIERIEFKVPGFYSESMRQVVSSYALYTRALVGDVDVAKARTLVEKAGGADKLPVEAAGWLLGALASEEIPEKEALLRHLENSVTETAGAASFAAGYEDADHMLLSSGRRADAVVLESLILANPKLDLIPRVVTGLLAHRNAGRWRNTQENVFVLLALERYFRTYEKVDPDFVARLWLGDDYAGDHAFHGHSVESHTVKIPAKELGARAGGDLVIQKDGQGRLYYRAALSYAPKSFDSAAVDRGFVVERQYEGVDDAADVVREGDGSWKIRLGSRVRVRLRLLNEARRYQVALVDPLPAGLEPLVPAKPARSRVPDSFDEDGDLFFLWWNESWYDHDNLRDDRAEAFALQLQAGDHVYEYTARATTRGTYVVPPTKAEEMYMPETFGRAASTRVVVE